MRMSARLRCVDVVAGALPSFSEAAYGKPLQAGWRRGKRKRTRQSNGRRARNKRQQTCPCNRTSGKRVCITPILGMKGNAQEACSFGTSPYFSHDTYRQQNVCRQKKTQEELQRHPDKSE